MSGILSYSVHLPSYRLSAMTVLAAWGRSGRGGAKSVANHDEDPLTMAHQAAIPIADSAVEALVFASTSSPWAEKSAATYLAMTLDLPPNAEAYDASGSLNSGARELARALARDGATLIAASDLRIGEPGSPNETTFGDGAAAVRVGPAGEAIATLITRVGRPREFTDQWRLAGDRYVRADDARFALTEGYQKTMAGAVTALLKKAGVEPSAIARAAISSPDPRSGPALMTKLGFDPKKQLTPDPAMQVGATGTAHPLLLLAALLESAKPGDKLLLAAYGDGAEVFLFEATDRLAGYRSPARLDDALGVARPLEGYAKYLSFRHLIAGMGESESVFASHIERQRDQEPLLRLHARVCDSCERIDTLYLPTCPKCGNREAFSERKLSRTGTVFTHTVEHYYPSPEGRTGMCVVDLDGGGRLVVQATDARPDELAIGSAVELTLRRLHRGGGLDNYFWKCRPKR